MSYFYIPHKVDDEEIILVVRRHTIIFTLHMLFWIMLAVAPIIIYFIIQWFDLEVEISIIVLNIGIFVASIYYLYILLFGFHAFVDYYLDIWLVTNKRILNMEQHGLFGRTVSELYLSKIQDVTYDISGFLETVFNYGNIHIQTAGESQRFNFEEVPNPQDIAQKINQIIHKHTMV